MNTSIQEPIWAEQCRRCVNLKSSQRGQHLRCRALVMPDAKMGWVADARRDGGICGPEGKAFIPIATTNP